jgi:O-antigen ligase
VLYIAAPLAIIALALLAISPRLGVLALFIVRPLVDATWATPLVFGLKLTEIVSAATPIIVLIRLVIDDGKLKSFTDMPLKWIWVAWSLDVVLFSSTIMFAQGLVDGSNILLRHLNGLAGFYMLQAYCRDKDDLLRWAWVVALAGIFPIVTGVFEGVTGAHWKTTYGEDGVIRNIGMYHDAITIRYYALQTTMGLLLIAALSERKSLWLKIGLLAYGALAVFVIKGAYSKSGFLTLGAWLVLWPLLLRHTKALMGLSAAAVVGFAYYAEAIMNSIGFVFWKELSALQGTVGVERTFSGRWHIWNEAIAEWQSSGTFSQLFGSGHVALGVHNDYLQILIHGGVIGLVIYLMLLAGTGVLIARALIQKRDALAVAALLAFIMWNIDAIGLVPSAYSGYQWFVWGLIGVCLRLRANSTPWMPSDSKVTVANVPRFSNLMRAS